MWEQEVDKSDLDFNKGEVSVDRVRKDKRKVWEMRRLVQDAEKGMWEEVLEAEKLGLASEDEVAWEVERSGESEDRLRAWSERREGRFVKHKGYWAHGDHYIDG